MLVVDDDLDVLELFARPMRAQGAAVRTASTVVGALAILKTWQPDLVLCDLHLPFVDGYSLLEQMRTSERLRSLPVIAISGSHPGLERDKALSAGFAELLTKPTRISEIVDAIVRAVGERPPSA